MRLTGQRKFNCVVQSTRKSIVDVFAEITCQDDRAFMFFKFGEKPCALDVRISVVSVFHFRALSKECVGLIEKKNCVAGVSGTEDLIQSFFSFSYVFTDHTRQVDLVKIKTQITCNDTCGHCLTDPGWT